MKKIILCTLLAAMLVFSFSCKKDSTETTATSCSAMVEGTKWTAANTMVVHSTGGNTTQFLASGAAPSEQIAIYFKGSGTGTFKFNDDNLGSVVVGNYVFTSLFSDTPVGEIVITKYDAANKKISGTFTFQGEDIDGVVYHVTEGKFDNVTLTVQ
jgi:hypothetical protein